MSFVSMELRPAKKVWKSFTSKLRSKLWKLRRSKAIKKPETRLHASSFLDQNMRRKKHLLLPAHQCLRLRSHRRDLFKKKAAPVYIDGLFKEPLVAELVAKYPPSSAKNNGKEVVVQDEKGRGPGTSSKEEKGRGFCAADDLWESLALASPQMHGIDQRAEEFIKKFRAEMELQEMMARRL